MLKPFNDTGRVVVLTGAGISAESGLATFRDSDGLWEKHDPMEIATPEAFAWKSVFFLSPRMWMIYMSGVAPPVFAICMESSAVCCAPTAIAACQPSETLMPALPVRSAVTAADCALISSGLVKCLTTWTL